MGTEVVPEGTGEAHLFRILEHLALCRLSSADDAAPSLEAFGAALAEVPDHEPIVLVLPWDDARLQAVATHAVQTIHAQDLEEAHAG